ncbi:PIN domain-containing protein [Streptomyces sp. H39-S7]|uniref:PIN domain-containing protein n=1 Tax=Streptomyces sp. H39-S7 TaxID=3004357 RepID=UPI0022AF41C0|nr:PIN domain-containing protein [Streptomyces sp. H39-S7]MCZ4119550.1 PIN domain-containing protein [Streptomyces sp. H39-S7]
MSQKKPVPPTYKDRLLEQLALIEQDYVTVVESSQIRYVNPNRRGSNVFVVGAANWGWEPSGPEMEAQRMDLLGHLRDWKPRFCLLFPHPTPEVKKKLNRSLKHMENWLVRPNKWDQSIPQYVPEAVRLLRASVEQLRELTALLPADPWPVRLVVDTNVLIDDPDLAIFTDQIGSRYMAHLLPVVLRELDDHKRAGRNETLREAARKADRRLKGLRTGGDVTRGVRVSGDVHVVFEHIEPKSKSLPDWLDLAVPDDRFVASALLLQSRHPGSAMFVATSDINLQTKLSAIALPFIEP